MIRVSLNELAVRYSRALQALGLPEGVADDGAAVIAWHDVVGLDGLGQLRAARPRLDATAAAMPGMDADRGTWRMDADGGSLIGLAGALVDALTMAVEAGADGVVLSRARDTALTGGLAALAAGRGIAGSFRARPHGGDTVHALSDGEGVWWARAPGTAEGDVPPGHIRAWGARSTVAWPPAGASASLDAPAVAARRATAIAHGVPVDADGWAEIYALAKHVLVDDGGA